MLTDALDGIAGNFFCTGGDEVNLLCYEDDPQTQASLRTQNKTLLEALAHFVTHIHDTIQRAGKTPLVWEDSVIGDTAVPAHPGVIVIAWKGVETFASILAAGFRVLQASSEHFYLDCGMGGWVRSQTKNTADAYFDALSVRLVLFLLGAGILLGAESIPSTLPQASLKARGIF